MFAAYPSEALLNAPLLGRLLDLPTNIMARLEKLACENTILLGTFVNYGRKKGL
jgi:hypothetical protein